MEYLPYFLLDWRLKILMKNNLKTEIKTLKLRKMNTEIKDLFETHSLKNGLIFLKFSNFEKGMKIFEESNEMQKHIFTDSTAMSCDIKDFPVGVAVLFPTVPGQLNEWSCVSTDEGIMFGNSHNFTKEAILSSPSAEGKKSFGFLFYSSFKK